MHILRRGTICVEGNIGCGKTTFLDFFRQKFQTTGEEELIQGQSIIAEPVEKWRNVEGENLFHYLYKDPARYSLAFQTYVQLTMMKLHMARPRMMERSIYSARYCFVENLFQLNYLSRLEYVILDKWFKHLVLSGRDEDLLDVPKDELKEKEYALLSKPTGVNLDMIVYLRCKPQKVMDRIKVRSRKEEKDISIEYIQSLHDLHENWLMSGKFPVPAPVLVLDTNCKQSSLTKLYEKAAPYLRGEKKLSNSPTEISINDDENEDNGDNQTMTNGFHQTTFKL
uniref:Thymidine kinase 2, mitochondrial n=1 Tax=Aceria tosichella TaxID=561515 RepID=A0A6G1SF43_9ACAR